MHGIDPGDDTYTTTKEDGRMSQKVKNAAEVPTVHNLVIVNSFVVSVICASTDNPLLRSTYSFHVTAEVL